MFKTTLALSLLAAAGVSLELRGRDGCWAASAAAVSSAEDCDYLYVEARDATVWGGACHISSQAATGGSNLVGAWSFSDARVVLAIAGDANLEAHEVFHTGDAPNVRVAAWVDAADGASAEAALARALHLAGDLPAPVEVARAKIGFGIDGEGFRVTVPGILELEGALVPDRACCTMPEDRWYSPLDAASESIVGFAERCRFAGGGTLPGWAYEGENSVFVARQGS